MAGFLFNSHVPTTLTLDIVMAGFILFVRTLTTIWGGTPQALVLRLAWTWLDGAACIRQLQYTRILATTLPYCRMLLCGGRSCSPSSPLCLIVVVTRTVMGFSKDFKGKIRKTLGAKRREKFSILDELRAGNHEKSHPHSRIRRRRAGFLHFFNSFAHNLSR